MTLKARIVVLDADGMKVGEIVGIPRRHDALVFDDVTNRLAEAEAYLSRLLGMTVKIETEVP